MVFIEYVKSDLYRYTGKVTVFHFFKQYLTCRGVNFCFWLRLAQTNSIVRYFAILILFFKRRRYGIDISHKTQIGYGFYIGHGGPIIINSTAIIGNNVNVSQYTTIGANNGKAAIIGNNVYIGPNVCIVENVCIGDNASIGAGSVVTKNIPKNATAVGNYAKIINFNNPGKFIQNKWIIS